MNRREKIKELRAALESAALRARELRRTKPGSDEALQAGFREGEAEGALTRFLESREPRELRRGDVIEVDRLGEVRNGDDVCRVVRGLRKLRWPEGRVEFVIYVIPASEPESGDDEAWENEDVEELVVEPGERFRLVSRKEKKGSN